MSEGNEKSSNRRRSRRVSVAGFTPRPMAIPVVEVRLGAVPNVEKRGLLALHLAETCYECFRIENLFRELLECGPADDDRIQTALINLEIAFHHISRHIRVLRRPLADVIRALDSRLGKRERKRIKPRA